MDKAVFKPDFQSLISNYNIVYNQYIGLRRRLKRNPILEEEYDQVKNKFVARYDVEEVNESLNYDSLTVAIPKDWSPFNTMPEAPQVPDSCQTLI